MSGAQLREAAEAFSALRIALARAAALRADWSGIFAVSRRNSRCAGRNSASGSVTPAKARAASLAAAVTSMPRATDMS